MNELRHDWMSSELDECDDEEREIRLAELCGCGWLDPVQLERMIAVRETERTQEIVHNQCISVFGVVRVQPSETDPGLTYGRWAA
jgi:hypothetical protein